MESVVETARDTSRVLVVKMFHEFPPEILAR